MRLTRTRSLFAAGMVTLAGTATAAVLIAGPASATPAAATSSHPVVLVNCNGQGLVKPATYDIFCMPSQQVISGLSWTSWRSTAYGSGTFKQNNCNPSCANGRFVKFPILVVLWRAQAWPRHSGRQYFSRVTWIFTGKRPPGVKVAAQTFNLPAAAQP